MVSNTPPRKLSVEPSHPHYAEFALPIRVWVNGLEVSGVVTYDQDEGWIERHKPYEQGSDIFRLQGEFQIERITGEVKVEWKNADS